MLILFFSLFKNNIFITNKVMEDILSKMLFVTKLKWTTSQSSTLHFYHPSDPIPWVLTYNIAAILWVSYTVPWFFLSNPTTTPRAPFTRPLWTSKFLANITYKEKQTEKKKKKTAKYFLHKSLSVAIQTVLLWRNSATEFTYMYKGNITEEVLPELLL